MDRTERPRLGALGSGVACSVLLVLAWAAFPSAMLGQVVATPMLEGTAYVGDTTMTDGTVVLHRLSEGSQGELDSLAVGRDGAFAFPLPNVPDPARSDVFFASIRHDGVLYFGPAITAAVQLDSVYEIHAYDTLLAPAQGAPVALQSRSVFFEPDSAGWRVTDLFQVRNDEPRTIVARSGGRVWSHPLPAQAYDVRTGEGELAIDAAQFEDGALVVRAALPPGERLFVVRYQVPSPELTIPNESPVETMDVLIREPAPPLSVDGLELVDRIELEAGSTYLRFSGTDVTVPSIAIVAAEEESAPRVEWAAVFLALVLTAAALFILRPSGAETAVPPRSPAGREALVRQVALLDEEFEAAGGTEERRPEYERRRAELIRRIRALG
ncbi:MAG: hypothetical protein OEN56_13815 [Gemmatimonadota bacterium]|nr:hypothetical protein [Gemmatimonadota bacterium]